MSTQNGSDRNKGTRRMNANYKGNDKVEQNKTDNSDFKMWLASMKKKTIANEIQRAYGRRKVKK